MVMKPLDKMEPLGRGSPDSEGGREAVKDVEALRGEMRYALAVELTDEEVGELLRFYHSLGLERCRFAIRRAWEERKYFWVYVRGILRRLEAQMKREREKQLPQGSKGYGSYGSPKGYGFYGSPKGAPYGGGSHKASREERKTIFQTHKQTVVTPLERLAIESALREEYGENWREICYESKNQ